MNCATHTRYCRSRFLPHLRQTPLRQLHPRRSRSRLLRALPRSPSRRHCPSSGIRASANRVPGMGAPVLPRDLRPAPAPIPQLPASSLDSFPSASAPSTARNTPRDWRTCSSSPCSFSATDHAGNWDWLFGIGIAFFYVYQIIDAVRTAHALQAGQPAPDPMGLGQTFSMGEKFDSSKVPVGAVILIGLGVLFLLHTMGIMEYGFEQLLAADSHLPRRMDVLPQL